MTKRPFLLAFQAGCEVSIITSSQRKSILADPVTLYTKSHPNSSEEKLAALSQFRQQYLDLKKQHKTISKLCMQTSRQIGEAKRSGLPADSLIREMQEQSSEKNNLEIRLNNISDKIIGYFDTSSTSDNSNEKLPGLPPLRTHPDDSAITGEISITLLDEPNEHWNHYAESNPAASIYHRAEWRDLIHKTFGHECYYFYAHNPSGQVLGILPLVRLKSRLFGDFMISMPYFNSGGPIADSLSIEQKLIHSANHHAENLGAGHIEYRDDIPRKELASRTEKVNMILPLPDTHEALWASFTSKLRSQIKRPQREDVHVYFGGEEFLDDFYTVFAHNMRDLGTPVYGKTFFRNILKTFTQHCEIIIVYIDKRPVAAAFLIGYNNTLEIPWASTIKDVNHLSINMLLYWEVLKFAIDKKYKYFDFGRSSKESGTFQFKYQWGARPKQLYIHYWLNNKNEIPVLNPSNAKYSLLINIWKRLPVGLTRLIGPPIVKYLP